VGTLERIEDGMSTDMNPIPRSMLFTPATKASYFDVDADAVILDLADSVATAAKDQARRAALNYLGSERPSGVRTALRINSPATVAGWQDLTALLQSPRNLDFVVIPKAESADVAGLVKSLLAQARNVLLTHAAAVAIPVIDSPFFDIGDDVGPEHAARRAVAEGFAGKAAIHPSQIPVINAAFRPDEREIDWAREVIEANRAGVGAVAGLMVDEAVARHAHRILQSVDRVDH
jgi:(S)-citramalyl-CoA lyase